MKTTSVLLIIEQLFLDNIVYDFNITEGVKKSFIDEITQIISSKYVLDSKPIYLENHLLKEGESRETIIKALWEYQKSLLPEGYYINEIREDNGGICLIGGINIYTKHKDHHVADFYDDITRIITITKFEEDLLK